MVASLNRGRLRRAMPTIVVMALPILISPCSAKDLTHRSRRESLRSIRAGSSTLSNEKSLSGFEDFLADLAGLQELEASCPVLSSTHSKRDSSYTKSWTFADWESYQLQSFHRYRQHLVSWIRSPTALAVLPAVAAVVGWSLLVAWLAARFPLIGQKVANSSLTPGLALFTAPISLLLALRTNRALNRLLEARSQFGVMVRAVSTLASFCLIHVTPIDQEAAILMIRYLSIFGWATKGLLRGERDTELVKHMLPASEAAWTDGSGIDTPSTIIFRLRQLFADALGRLPLVVNQSMEARLVELEVVLGVCKRIKGTPMPPTYTRHTSRVLCLYLGLLPFALVGSKTPIPAIVVIVSLLSYVLIGIDEISVEIEYPFPLLPMHSLCHVIQNSILSQIGLTRGIGEIHVA